MCFSSLRQWFAKNTDHCYELLEICNPLFCKLSVLTFINALGSHSVNIQVVSFLHIKPKILRKSNIYEKVGGATKRCSKEQTNTGFLNAIFISNARQGFLLKFGTKICEVILYSCMKCCPRSSHTRPCRAKCSLLHQSIMWDHHFCGISCSSEW